LAACITRRAARPWGRCTSPAARGSNTRLGRPAQAGRKPPQRWQDRLTSEWLVTGLELGTGDFCALRHQERTILAVSISRNEVGSISSATGDIDVASSAALGTFCVAIVVLTFSQGLHGIHPACGECGQIACQCRHEKQDRGSAEQTQRIGRAEAEEHPRERAADKKGDR
jgi:hypothetical protein